MRRSLKKTSKNSSNPRVKKKWWHSFLAKVLPAKFLPLTNEPETEESPLPILPNEENLQLTHALLLKSLSAQDIMTPRADIVAIDIESSFKEIIEFMAQKPHSRFPVYRESLDNIIGMLHIKDVVARCLEPEEFSITEALRNVLFISPTMHLHDLLLSMQKNRTHMALIVDEFGGTDGLITLENIIEEIVGEMQDEHEVSETIQFIKRPDGSLIVDARFLIEDLEKQLGPILTLEEREEDIDTLGGFVSFLAGRVPHRGEKINHISGLAFEVLDADPRRVRRLCIRNLPALETP